ncbi:hypothetical protein PF005_g13604 [Phytophthora fragariae]|uniref:Malic enzyme N-terminal domain-containing protein n=1 Tax=Phytophthora fragariae TaxID=53985 RepID=A0A6A3RZV6_9STRA|nr:hypothetical protein PF003_g3738 [Phytophthora fragariae]KAE9103695.1 hypothetical protein PF007_g14309 [Phytophthora fragariae]KAE9204950.1 hypothetical protein PF005_g13604 [Phytophthora fragariae]KAE9222965.1 hypothetical protein PF002_g15099 [Phytophthora fragariae]KAE9303536.1 hypothetical protein PF001_g13493 [Phytophthora fragariae]
MASAGRPERQWLEHPCRQAVAVYGLRQSAAPDVLPVVLDCGTNNEEYHAFYIGLHEKRVRSEKFEQPVDAFMNASKAKYGDEVLL